MIRVLLLICTVLIMTTCLFKHPEQRVTTSPQFSEDQGKFINSPPAKIGGLKNMWKASKEFFFNKHPDTTPGIDIPVKKLMPSELAPNNEKELKFVRLGHSTLLLQLNGRNWLLDPVFSDRASPVQWAGPKRFHATPLSMDELPEIEGVVISHNHYDHMDYDSIKQLKGKVKHFIVPLGNRAILTGWGVDPKKVVELDWWESVSLGGVELISTPSQHFSGRGVFDTDKTLWSSWVIRTASESVYFSGDSGYFPGFREIGNRYGPFDYAFMECGAYNLAWKEVHMMPEETVQAFKDVQGKVLVPIHNGTFDLATHAWYEPLERVSELAAKENLTLLTPVMGEIIRHRSEPRHENNFWWKSLMSNESP